MAKYYKAPKHVVGRMITTKSAFGSHADMIVNCDDDIFKHIKLENSYNVVCKDDDGYYITKLQHIDSGMADPNRYANSSARVFIPHNSIESEIETNETTTAI